MVRLTDDIEESVLSKKSSFLLSSRGVFPKPVYLPPWLGGKCLNKCHYNQIMLFQEVNIKTVYNQCKHLLRATSIFLLHSVEVVILLSFYIITKNRKTCKGKQK